MNPAAVLAVVVKAQGVATTNKQLAGVNSNLVRTNATGTKATKTLGGVGKAGTKASGGLFSAAKSAGGLIAAYAGFKGIEKSVNTTEDLAKTTLGLAKNFGLTTKAASEWAAVAQSRGIGGKQLTMGFKSVANAVRGAATGSKQAQQSFTDLGISQADLAKHGNDTSQVLGMISDGMAKLPPGTNKAAIMAKLFGRTWQTIAPLIRGGSQAMNEQLAAADKYGATFGGKSLKSVEEMVKAQRQAKLASIGLQITLGTTLVPVLTAVASGIAKFVAAFRAGTGTAGQFRDGIDRVLAVLSPFGESVKQIVHWLGEHQKVANILIPALAGLAVAVWAVNTALAANPFVLAAVAIAALTVGIVTAYRESATFRSIVQAVFTWFVGAIQTVRDVSVLAWGAVSGAFISATHTITTEVGSWKVLFAVIGGLFTALVSTARLAMSALVVTFRAGMLLLAPIATAVWTLVKGIFSGAWTALKGIVTGGLQIVRGVIQVFGGLFKGDFGQMWNGVKTIFTGGITALKGILGGAWKVLKAPVDAVANGLHDAFSSSWDRIKGVFSAGFDAIKKFVQLIIDVIWIIPGLGKKPNVTGGGGGKGGGRPDTAGNPNVVGHARGGAFARTGGYVNSPITLMGEEAPRHPEYVIPTNPAYRGRARGLVRQAAQAVGMAKGGVYSQGEIEDLWTSQGGASTRELIASAVAMAESSGNANATSPNPAGGQNLGLWQIWSGNAGATLNPAGNARAAIRLSHDGSNWGLWEAYTNGNYQRFMGKGRAGGGLPGKGINIPSVGDLLGKLPGVGDLPGWMGGVGKWAIGKATSYIKDAIGGLFSEGSGQGLVAKGKAGVGSFQGIAMANWVIEALQYAQSKGVDVRPTSGYRPGFDPHTRTGTSEHQGTQYPHGAVDFGGPDSGLAMKMAVVNATRDFKYPLLAPIGFHDDGHASGTGHARGGVFKYLGGFARGGVTQSDGMAYLHKHEAVVPMKGGGGFGRGNLLRNVNPGGIRAFQPSWGTPKPHKGAPRPGYTPPAAPDAPEPIPDQTLDWIKAAVAQARLTADTADDRAAQRQMQDYLQQQYDSAVASGDPTAIADAANALADTMSDAIAELTRIEERRLALDEEIAGRQKRLETLINTQGPQMIAAVVQAVSGGIGGKVGLGFQSPSYPGGVAAY